MSNTDKMKRVRFRIWCQAYYYSTLEIPENLTNEEQIEYIRDHLPDASLGTLHYLPDSDEIDENDLDLCEIVDLAQEKNSR